MTYVLVVGVQEDLENIETSMGGVFDKVLNNKKFLTGESFDDAAFYFPFSLYTITNQDSRGFIC